MGLTGSTGGTGVVMVVMLLASPLAAQSVDDGMASREPRPAARVNEDSSGYRDASEREASPLLRQLGRDFQRLFTSTDTLPVLGVGLGGGALAVPADPAIPASPFNSQGAEGTALDRAFDPGKLAGSALVQVGGAVSVLAMGRVFAKPGLASLGSDLVRAQVMTQALTQGVKLGARRTRPDGSNRQSFPSGHASGAFATATVLQRRYGWRVGGVAYGVAGYIAASRLNENKHYLSDVIFGASLGILAGRTVTLDLGERHLEVSPTVGRGAAGVQVTLVSGR